MSEATEAPRVELDRSGWVGSQPTHVPLHYAALKPRSLHASASLPPEAQAQAAARRVVGLGDSVRGE